MWDLIEVTGWVGVYVGFGGDDRRVGVYMGFG